VEIYTIGFAGRSAESFFEALKAAGIDRLIDVRLNNTSQLAGFTKKADLEYFLREICGADYVHETVLAPTEELLKAYRSKAISWDEYERRFWSLMAERRIEERLAPSLFATKAVLLCSEKTADHCHRRLIVEYLDRKWGEVRGIDL
jgi:uncharacterized protein (DUF488 family)